MSYLTIQNLCKNYVQAGQTIEVIKNLNLTVTKGETVAVLGQSGSGKSTLLSLLAGLDRPDSGEISIDSQNFLSMGEKDLSIFRGISMGIVFQQFHLMKHLTALENTALPLEIHKQADAKANATKALKNVGLDHRLQHYPHQLSGGEQQRVAIARALVASPPLILADEPSGNLDSETGFMVMDQLFDLVKTKNITFILVTHNAQLSKKCDKIFTLTQGQLS